jgi:hypothetical protein
MTKQFLWAAMLIGCIGTVAPVDAAYVIKLKNGNEYLTTRYWNEGSQVRFDTYGGVFGVDKSFVAKIERADRFVPLPISATSASPTLLQEPASSRSLTGKGTATLKTGEKDTNDIKATKPAQPAKQLPKKDENVLKEYAELQTRFGQLNDLPAHEIYALDSDIALFRQKVGSSDLAEAHKDELDAMRTLQGAIASYLKASQR